MVVTSIQQIRDLSYPLQEQHIFSPDTSLTTILPINDYSPKRSRFENLKTFDAPINYRSKWQNSFVGFGVLLTIAMSAIYMYVEETWVSGIISIICAVVMITAFWLHLFEDDTFSRHESRKMHRLITFLLYIAFLLSLASSILAMVNVVTVYNDGDTVTEQYGISNNSNSTNSTSNNTSEYSMNQYTRRCISDTNLKCSGVLESSPDSFGSFLGTNPILIAMIVLESVQFLLYGVLIWNTWAFGKVLDRMQQLIDGLNRDKVKFTEIELGTFSEANGLVVVY